MITELINVNKLSDALEDFSKELELNSEIPKLAMIYKIILYYTYLSDRSPFRNNLIETSSQQEIVDRIRMDFYLSSPTSSRLLGNVKRGLGNLYKRIKLGFIISKFKNVEVIFLIKNKKFYDYIAPLIQNKESVLIMLFDDDLETELSLDKKKCPQT